VERHQIKPEEIDQVNIKTLDRVGQFLADTKIETIFDAQFSLPYALAMLLLGQKPGPEWLSEENMFRNEKVKAIEKKIKIEVDPEAEKIFAQESGEAIMSTVEIKTTQGKVYTEQMKYPKGSPRNPFTPKGLTEKFKMVSSALFSEKRVERLLEEINRLDKVENISNLMELLREER
jgi:2-methylcitrate dehydratase